MGATALAVTTAGAAQAEAPSTGTQLYLVQVAGAPVASYGGDIAGLPATRPAEGQKVNANSAAANAYRSRLKAKQRDALGRARIAESRTTNSYGVTFNGFAARLTKAEATRLAQTKDVLHVWKNEIREAEATTTPGFVGLSGAGGTWAKEFRNVGRAGEGVIIGDIDSGFWPENPSFGPLPEPRGRRGHDRGQVPWHL